MFILRKKIAMIDGVDRDDNDVRDMIVIIS